MIPCKKPVLFHYCVSFSLLVGLLFFCSGKACSSEIDAYSNFIPSNTKYCIYLDNYGDNQHTTIAKVLKESNVRPVHVLSDKEYRPLVALGTFDTIMEAHIWAKWLRSNGNPNALITTRTISYRSEPLDLPTSSPITLPFKLAPDDDQMNLKVQNILHDELGTTYSIEAFNNLLLDVDHSDFLTTQIIESVINKIPNESATKIEFILNYAKRLVSMRLAPDVLNRYKDTFYKGLLACEPSLYHRIVLVFADYEHEYTNNPVRAGLLYMHVLNSNKSMLATDGQRARALVELTALSREFVQRGVGSYVDTAYWWYLYKASKFSVNSRAAAVIELIMLENYKSANMASLINNINVRSKFDELCNSFHSRYSQYKRERLFMYSLQLGVHLSANSEDAIKIAMRAAALHPFNSKEYPQWQGKREMPLPGMLLAALNMTVKNNLLKEQEEIESLIINTVSNDPVPELECHLMFEE